MTTAYFESDAATPHHARVLLAEDHPTMLATAAAMLEGECVVVGSVADGQALLDAVERLRPEIVVLDITMPQISGLDAAREIHSSHPRIALVFLTVHEDADFARAAFEAGAAGYVVKSRLATDLLCGIRAALAGQRFLSPVVHFDDAA